MYGKGTIIEPDLDCLGCYKGDFDNKCPVKNCMDLISPEQIINEVEKFEIYKK